MGDDRRPDDGEVSDCISGDRVRLIAELYKVYSACHNEPFDKFYFWGDMLTDFDDTRSTNT